MQLEPRFPYPCGVIPETGRGCAGRQDANPGGFMPYVDMDELGRFWVFNDEDEPYGGPYDTPEDAVKWHPEAE